MHTITTPKANDPCWCGSGKKFKRCHKVAGDRIRPGVISPRRAVPDEIAKPHYATTGGRRRRGEAMIKDPGTIQRKRPPRPAAAPSLPPGGGPGAPARPPPRPPPPCPAARAPP